MKKSLIALAVLAASGASFAQSTVSVYGIADIWFGSTSTTGQPSQTVLQSGGVSGSRWGLKGTEDLGGGLKANFVLEQGFNLDDGTAKTANEAFGRYAYVGFSGGFGEVRLGKVGTAYDDINGNGHDVFDSALSSNNGVWDKYLGYAGTANNNIYFASNNYSGFSAAVSYSLGENKTNAASPQVGDGSASGVTSLNAQYAAGPLYVGLGYQTEKPQGGGDNLKSTRVNASYNFGPAKLLADVGHVTKGDATINQWTLGVDVPVSAALTVSAGYSKSTDNTAAGVISGDDGRKGYAIGAAYSLSKRTTVYAGYHHDTEDKLVGGDITNKITAVGVKHTF